ncbi:MAG TPA: putative 2OG-Fe(II) oxygenase [Allosphingosinicella sp.]|jgi:tetratricopeptide (TPR) repeat protein
MTLEGEASADAVYAAGVEAVNAGREVEALPFFEAAAARNPDDARMWQLVGLAHRKADDLAPALVAFERAARLAPTDALLAHSVARTRMEAGLPAVDQFEAALALGANDEWTYLGWLAALCAEGRCEQAIEALENQVRSFPTWMAGHGTLARMRWMRGDREDFARSYEGAAAAAPRELAVWSQWGDALMYAERYDAVLAMVARGRAANGALMAFDTIEALAVAEKGEIEQADRLFAALGPVQHVAMAAHVLRHLIRAGRPAEAAAFAESWLADPDAHLVWPYVSLAWRQTGDPRWQWLEGDERQIGIYDIGDRVGSLDALAERLRALHAVSGQPLEQSVRGGTQTEGALLSRLDPEIQALKAAIVESVERHIAQLPPPDAGHPTLRAANGPVRFTGSWSVRLEGTGFHSNHMHPAGWISSAFYVSLPEAMGSGDEGRLVLGEPQAHLGLDLAPLRVIEPKPGRLVLFPSTMWHGTRPFAAGERMSVAFDVARPS